MKYIDLFAGAGGMSLGFKRSGAELVFANEYEPSAAETLIRNLSKRGVLDANEKVIQAPIQLLNKEVLGLDIKDQLLGETVANVGVAENTLNRNTRNAEFSKLKKLKNRLHEIEVDVIIGGPPCQGFSTVGRGKRGTKEERMNQFVDDPRNSLFKHFLGVVGYFKPKAVLIENVKGLLSAMSYSDLIIQSIESLGYYIDKQPLVLNSVDFGVPQNRERVFFVGFSIEKNVAPKKQAEKFLEYLVSKKIPKSQRTVLKDAIGDLPSIEPNPKKNNLSVNTEIPIGDHGSWGEYESRREYLDLIDVQSQSKYVQEINGGEFYQTLKGFKLYNHKARFQNNDDLKIYSLLSPGKYLDHVDNSSARELCKYDISSFKDKYFKLSYGKPSKTIVAHLSNDNNAYVHPGNVPRGISPREAARIQSFPDWYQFMGSFSSQFRQIGNAVPPLLAQRLAEALKNSM